LGVKLQAVQSLQALDVELFRFVNERLANPFFDVVMPFASGNVFFVPLVIATGILLVWKGRVRGLVCVLMLALVLPVGDGLIYRTIKHAVGRPRPFLTLTAVRRPGRNNEGMARPPPSTPQPNGKPAPGSGSMPSAHAANWFAATMIAFIYYRRSLRFMLPLALLVSFSRIYNGVHYPSDVLAGAALGAGYAAAAVWVLAALWVRAGRRWFPVQWARLPSLLDPTLQPAPGSSEVVRLAEDTWRELQ
jgi:undecaprenyl-diphosphatase